MRILSIDPGHITGVACYNKLGVLEWAMTLLQVAWEDRTFLASLVHLANPDLVLLEGLPTKFVDQKTSDLFHELKYWFEKSSRKVVVIKPAEWKGMAKRVEIAGTHARDAATMAKWYIERGRDND